MLCVTARTRDTPPWLLLELLLGFVSRFVSKACKSLFFIAVAVEYIPTTACFAAKSDPLTPPKLVAVAIRI